MRRLLWLTGVTATGLGLALASAGAMNSPTEGVPLCRRAPALAQLPPEALPVVQSPQRPEPVPEIEEVAEVAMDSPMAMPAPPPPSPPPPPPPPPIVAERGGSDEIAVTGSRVARPSVNATSPVAAVPPEMSNAPDGV